MKQLTGKVAPVTARPAAPDTARDAAIVAAAMDYVAALRDWEERASYNEMRRKAVHRAQRRLVDAVTGHHA
jgi:hypothetical protein